MEFGRYLDVDGDGIPYRTLPGTHPTRGAFFTRGTTKDRYARYTEEGRDYVDNMQRLLHKFETAKRLVPPPVRRDGTRADHASARSISARPRRRWTRRSKRSKRAASISTRCACAPSRSTTTSLDFIAAHDRVFVVEQNRDAQLRTLLINERRDRPGQARADPALRRHADHRPLHRQGDRRHARRRHPRPAQKALPMSAQCRSA